MQKQEKERILVIKSFIFFNLINHKKTQPDDKYKTLL